MNTAQLIDRWIEAEAKYLHALDRRTGTVFQPLSWENLLADDREYFISKARKIVEPQLLVRDDPRGRPVGPRDKYGRFVLVER